MAGALVLFVIFVIIYVVISDIITVFFRLTGLTEENARFQVISLLTNSGFTTRESEAIVSSKVRRRLARATMLFGYAFTVTIVATMVNFFTNISKSELKAFIEIIPLLLFVIIMFILMRNTPMIKTKFDKKIEFLGNLFMFGNKSNPIVIIEDYDDMVVAQAYVRIVPDCLRNTKLSDSTIRTEHNIMVLMVKTPYGDAKQATPDTIIKKNDIVMLLGKRSNIRELFEKIEGK